MTADPLSAGFGARHEIVRVRRETRRRDLTVESVTSLSPRMIRVILTSPELHDFGSAAHDDHIKLFLPVDGGEAAARDFTPRAFDPARGSLTVDFALHETGPASDWARRAKPGDALQIGGPRGSAIVPDDFDWYLFVGDETAIPAIARRLEELRPGVAVMTAIVVETEAEVPRMATAASWTREWVRRDAEGPDDAETLRRALDRLAWPPGEGFVWIAAEARVARALRAHVAETKSHLPAWTKAAGYWVRGEAGASEK